MSINAYEAMAAEHIGVAWARQDRLADLIGEADGMCDLSAGRLTFGADLDLSIGVLGSFDKAREVWTWSWASERLSSLTDAVLAPARALRTYGDEQDMAQFTQADIPAEENDCRMLSLLAVGHLDKGAYYRHAHGDEADYLVIEPVPALTCPTDAPRIPQLISEFATTGVASRTAVAAFFRAEGYDVTDDAEQEGTSTEMKARRGEIAFDVRFTRDGRVANISGDMPATLSPMPDDAESERPSLFSRLFGSALHT